jgi:hypothetical protein
MNRIADARSSRVSRTNQSCLYKFKKNYPRLRTYTIVEEGIGDIKLSKRDIEVSKKQ